MDRSIRRSRSCSRWFVALGFGFAGAMSIAPVQGQEPCGSPPVIYPFPYTDVAGVGAAFCPGIMEAYVTGVSKGTTPTTFSPTETVTRVQMTTFLQRSLDQGLTRASRRTVLKQLWQDNYYPQAILSSGLPVFCAADGDTIWVASQGEVDQIQASSGKVLASWTGPTKSWPIAVIPGAIITADNSAPNGLYFIDPTAPPGPISASYTLPGGASSIAFDGINYWIANFTGSVSILTGLTLQTYSAGFSKPVGLVYDGTQMWVTDYGAGTLLPVAPDGTIGTAVTVGAGPEQPAFDGENIWVPNYSDSSITVVQASSGKVVATIASDGVGGNNLSGPEQASFDGERILVTNRGNESITLFKAADLSVIGNVGFGASPYGVCSDGINFWVTFTSAGTLLKF
jgi:YVTN family beta-propeller protein